MEVKIEENDKKDPNQTKKVSVEMATVFKATVDENEHWICVLEITFHSNGTAFQIKNKNKHDNGMDDETYFFLPKEHSDLLAHQLLGDYDA